MVLYTIYSIYICKKLICLNAATIKICISLTTSCGKCVELTHKKKERKAEMEDNNNNNNLERFTNLCWIYYAAVALVFIWAIGQNVGQL